MIERGVACFVKLKKGGLNMKIAVTGATGQLGQHVVKGLLEKLSPQDVVAVVRDPAKATQLAQRGAVVRVAESPESKDYFSFLPARLGDDWCSIEM
jgi:nucleoside-diphosphate-sugar epimerase